MGNLLSVERAIRFVGSNPKITGSPEEVAEADMVILPGVGAFGEAIKYLEDSGLKNALIHFAKSGKPLLGICLGMQLLFSESNEFGFHSGLDLIPGKVVRFKEKQPSGNTYKIPHVGWKNIHLTHGNSVSPFHGIDQGSYFYFVHSYFAVPHDLKNIVATAQYAGKIFCAAARLDNVLGCQFHPEKSGPVGLKLLRNFCCEKPEGSNRERRGGINTMGVRLSNFGA